jgi:chaperonin GroEL
MAAGAELIKEAASRTHKDAGDGTTTSTVLAQAIIDVGYKNITAGANPIDLKRGIDKAVANVVKTLGDISIEIGYDNEKIKQIARISANNDNQIGDLIADAMSQINEDGVVTVEDSKDTETYVEVVEGMQFDRGYLSHYFVNNENGTCTYDNPKIFITDRVLSTMKDIEPLGHVLGGGNSLFIIAEDVEGEALATLIVNRLQKGSRICVIKTPGFGSMKKETMHDIATVVGAGVVSDELGVNMENFTQEMLGSCDKIVISSEKTTIIGGKGEKSDIEKRISLIKKERENTEKEADSFVLRDRLARLVNGIAVLYVGAASEVEMNEKKDRVDDALSATRAAIEEGIVPGGGVAYIRCIESLEGLKGDNDTESIGIQIVKEAIEEPLRRIVTNAGKESSVIVQYVKDKTGNFGYNVRTEVYEDLVEAGVIDPTKVTRVAIENAASVAGMFLTADCVIVDEDKK